MGDPGGIGPEVTVKGIAHPSVRAACSPVIAGDERLLRRIARQLGIKLAFVPAGKVMATRPGAVQVVSVGKAGAGALFNRPTAAAGRLAGKAIEAAVGMVLDKGAQGMVTAPASKQSLALAGYGMVGHTELISRLAGAKSYAMMLTRGSLRVVFATTHVALRAVAGGLTVRGLAGKMRLAADHLRVYMGITDPAVGVSCLNPHCGEGGFLGEEEKRIIEPAVNRARQMGLRVEGPYPSDSIFRPDLARRFDVIIAMYHDQGMIPLKLRNHDHVVNVTIGIPCIRTSPGHGTAFDIAGQGIASEKSMVKAILECARMIKRAGYAC
jgi:4-hydroxythreonine-4-phosphate dehydrogenase